ncbi:MAG: hypothetical protein JW929_16510 [Anaerolineales bacterium]|nr:hypothetical protein [Anaerolineales bacterium]
MCAKQYEDKLENLLRGAGISYRRRPSIGGLRPDFIVSGPHGEKIVLEVKLWDPRGGNTARAFRQVQLYKKATGADEALIVMPDLKKNYRRKGVVKLEAVVPALRKYFRLPEDSEPVQKPAPGVAESPAKARPRRTVFAAMPFAGEYDDTYFIAMSHAAEQVGAECRRVDRKEFSGDIVAEIKRLIRSSAAVIVDLSEAKPNVLYEAGYAHALRKPTVHICSTPLSDLPFDVRNWNTVPYRLGQTILLKEPLARRLKAVMVKK